MSCLANALALPDAEREAFTAAARTGDGQAAPAEAGPVDPVGETAPPGPEHLQNRTWRRRQIVAAVAVLMAAAVLWLALPAFRNQPGAATPPSQPPPTSKTSSLVKIISPEDGDVIPAEVRVHGTASLPTSTELWLLLQPQHGDSRFFGTTPKPITVDASGAWMATIRVGQGSRDGGHAYKLAAVVCPVNGGVKRHVKLLPDDEQYPKMAEIPGDCLPEHLIEVTRAK